MRNLALTLASCALAASCGTPQVAPAETPSDEAAAKSAQVVQEAAYSAPAAPQAAPAQDAQQKLIQQKRDLLMQNALENARALRESGEYEQARAHLEQALQVDPTNTEANLMYMEVMELLGDRPGELVTVSQAMEQRYGAMKEGRRLEAEEFYRLGSEARERGDYEAAIRNFERVNQSIRWDSLQIDWGDLATRNNEALSAARGEKLAAEKTASDTQLREAVTRIQEEENEQQAALDMRVANLLEKGTMKFDRGDYDAAIELAEQALGEDPASRAAESLKAESITARRQGRSEAYVPRRREAYRRLRREIDELRIPYSERLTPAPEDYWKNVESRSTADILNIEGSIDPLDRVIREQLKTKRIPEINFEDDELKTVTEVLTNFSGIPIIATPQVLSEVESNGELITLPSLSNISVHALLQIISANLGEEFSWTVRDGVVLFTTVEDAFGETVIRTHPIQDLTFDRTNFKGPQIDRISLPGEYGEDPETSVFASDLEGEVIINAEDIMEMIRQNVARETWDLGDEKFQIDVAASNQILVIHTPQVQAEIHQFLNELRQFASTVVYVESRFIEVTDAFLQEVGADFRGLGGVFGPDVVLDDVSVGAPNFSSRGLDNLGTGSAATASASAGIFFNDNSDGDVRARTENYFANPLGDILTTGGGGSFQFGVLDDTDFNLIVTAVEKSTKATEVMAPILTVFNTERAYISVINEISFLQDFDVDVANTAFIANPEIGILQEGVVLDVRPTVSYDRQYITLEIRTTVSEIDRPIETFETTLAGFTDPVTFQIPRMRARNANTTVVVPDGGSVILGGLKTITHVNRRAEIPWVSQIPLIGVLFRQKGVVDEKQTLVIMVRANISDISEFQK